MWEPMPSFRTRMPQDQVPLSPKQDASYFQSPKLKLGTH